MNITMASLSQQGERTSNQDQTGEVIGERAACFLVCDGVAGNAGGEVAARIARNAILTEFDGEQHLNPQFIRQYVNNANQAIRSEQKNDQDNSKMGTTLVSLFIDRDYHLAYWVHAGDSRLYLFRRGFFIPGYHRSQPDPAVKRCRAPDRRCQQQPALFCSGHG